MAQCWNASQPATQAPSVVPSQYVPGEQVAAHVLATGVMHACVALSQSEPVGQGNAGTLHPETQAPLPSHHMPGPQLTCEHGNEHVAVVWLQVPLFGQLALAQLSLQRPSPGSHFWPAAQPVVVQSAGATTHCELPRSHVAPVGQSPFAEQPAWHVSVCRLQYWPGAHPPIEQSGRDTAQRPSLHTEP